MADLLQLMVLPSNANDAPPQILLDEGGIWRECVQPPVNAPQSKLRHDAETLLHTLMTQVGAEPPLQVPVNYPALVRHFIGLQRNILSPEVRDAIREATLDANGRGPGLNIYFKPGSEWLPWELMHDGTTFLGLKFAIARLPIIQQATEVKGAPRQRTVRRVYNLLANDVLQNGVMQTWQNTFAAYAVNAGWECRYPVDAAGAYPSLLQLDEARDADIVHVTCHGGLRGSDNEAYWTLDHNSPQELNYHVTSIVAQNAQFSERPLVFGNACSSSIAGHGVDFNALQGFGTSFMVGGALNFVGTFAPITRTMAVSFAQRFYEHLFGAGGKPGLPIGEALRATKLSFAQSGSTDPSYLFYCLYGPPDVTYAPAP